MTCTKRICPRKNAKHLSRKVCIYNSYLVLICMFLFIKYINIHIYVAYVVISHAMARDGSSGGVIRLVVIDKDGVEKEVVMGDQLPYMPMEKYQ